MKWCILLYIFCPFVCNVWDEIIDKSQTIESHFMLSERSSCYPPRYVYPKIKTPCFSKTHLILRRILCFITNVWNVPKKRVKCVKVSMQNVSNNRFNKTRVRYNVFICPIIWNVYNEKVPHLQNIPNKRHLQTRFMMTQKNILNV